MWLIEGILTGLIAGIVMGVFSQLGYWQGIIRSHLIVIDGAFALRLSGRTGTNKAVYLTGTLIHLVTSAVFGGVYAVIARLAGFDPVTPLAVGLYVLLLWLAMLAVALPVAGQGFAGRRIRPSVWLEQLGLHVIFGFSFWLALLLI